MNSQNYTAVFDSAEVARRAIDALIKAGIPADDIVVATRHPGAETVFGTASSILPGKGPYSWGPLADLEPWAAVGSFTAAFVSTVPDGDAASIFEGQGLSPDEATHCAEALRRGGAVLQFALTVAAGSPQPLEDVLAELGARVFRTLPVDDV